MPKRARSRQGRSALTFLVTLVALVVVAAPALAQTQGPVERTPEEVAEMALALQIKYMSPYCPGANLRDCTSGKAAVLRDEIKAWVAAGWTEAQITDELVSRYGESILSAPRFKGFNMLVWIFPFVALIVGLGVIFWFLQRQHSMKLDSTIPAREVDPDYQGDPELEKKLERELSTRSN